MTAPVTIAAVGDLMPGDSAICVGFGFASLIRETPLNDIMTEVVPLLRAADIATGNLETPISRSGLNRRRWSSVQMRGRPEHAEELARCGFTVLNVANNHAVQHGLEAFHETVMLLRAAGVMVCGLRGADGWSSDPVRLNVRGRDVGLLGYSLRPRQFSTEDPPYAEGDPDRMVADISRLAKTSAVVVQLHWGEEFVARPSRAEAALGRRLMEAGALAVLGHHPHVVRPIARHGASIIAYSLGNLMCDMVWHEPLRHGLVLELELWNGVAEVSHVIETRIDDAFRPRLVRAAPAEADATDRGPLPGPEYDAEVARTVAAQRGAAYRYALQNLHRFPPQILAQFAGATIRNKLSALRERSA